MDNDFPTVMANGKGFLRQYLEGAEQYGQTGTDIPTFSVGRSYEGGSGTGMNPFFNEEFAASPSFGGTPQAPISEELKRKLMQPVTQPKEGFDEMRRRLGLPARPDLMAASFEIPKAQGALGKRSGEQLMRLQDSGIQNQQLQQELERRGIMPRGVQLPPV